MQVDHYETSDRSARRDHTFTHTSYAPARRGDGADSRGQRQTLCGSCVGAALGILMLVGASALLWFNEASAVRTQQSLSEAHLALAQGSNGLIHLTGMLETGDKTHLSDEAFGVASQALTLERVVEVYQWHEKEHKSNRRVPDGKGGELTETTTTYDYHADWARHEISSAGFKHPNGHRNPGFREALDEASHRSRLDFSGRSWRADVVTLDGLVLGPTLRSKAEALGDLELDRAQVERRLEAAGSAAVVSGRRHVYSEAACVDASSPRVGCVRAHWSHAPRQTVTVVAKHQPPSSRGSRGPRGAPVAAGPGGEGGGGRLVEWPNAAGAGYELALLEPGEHDASAMLARAASAASMALWLKRAGGALLMWMGYGLLFGPAQYLASWIPLLSGLVGCVLGMVAFGIALCHAVAVIAVAWLFQRPLLATAVLVVVFTSAAMGVQGLRRWRGGGGGGGGYSSSTPMSSKGKAM
jgi:hypothetical protein